MTINELPRLRRLLMSIETEALDPNLWHAQQTRHVVLAAIQAANDIVGRREEEA